MTDEEFHQVLRNHIEKYGRVDFVVGALGDVPGYCNTYVENVILSPENGFLTKYYGISYPYKGKIDNETIDRVTITKRAFIELITLLFKNKYLIPGILIFRKSFIKNAVDYAHSIYNPGASYEARSGLKAKELKHNEFCPALQELIRVGEKFAGRNEKIRDLVYCLAMFFQFSPSYLRRLQDLAGEINKENFKKSPIKELLRIKKIFLKREKSISVKGSYLFNLAIVALILGYKKQILEFILELDIEKIKPDEADKYFCLRQRGYDYGGLSLEDRLKKAEKIDKEKGHYIFGNEPENIKPFKFRNPWRGKGPILV